MIFLKVLETTKPRLTGSLVYGGKIWFARISKPLKYNLQQESFSER